MLHICKGAYLQLVIKCYILYKSTTLRKSEIRKKHYKRVKKYRQRKKQPYSLTGDTANKPFRFPQCRKAKRSNQERHKTDNNYQNSK